VLCAGRDVILRVLRDVCLGRLPSVSIHRYQSTGPRSLTENSAVVMAAHDFRKILLQVLEVPDAGPLQEEGQHHAQSLEAVDRADTKVDAGCFGKVACLDRNLLNGESKTDSLGNHLRVENKIVGIQQEGHLCEQQGAKGAENG